MGDACRAVGKLEADLGASGKIADTPSLADFYKDTIIPDMRVLRAAVDEMETMASSEKWPYPCYGELLFGVR